MDVAKGSFCVSPLLNLFVIKMCIGYIFII